MIPPLIVIRIIWHWIWTTSCRCWCGRRISVSGHMRWGRSMRLRWGRSRRNLLRFQFQLSSNSVCHCLRCLIRCLFPWEFSPYCIVITLFEKSSGRFQWVDCINDGMWYNHLLLLRALCIDVLWRIELKGWSRWSFMRNRSVSVLVIPCVKDQR